MGLGNATIECPDGRIGHIAVIAVVLHGKAKGELNIHLVALVGLKGK